MKNLRTGKRKTTSESGLWAVCAQVGFLIASVLLFGTVVAWIIRDEQGVFCAASFAEKQAIPCYAILIGVQGGMLQQQADEAETEQVSECAVACRSVPMNMELLEALVREQYAERSGRNRPAESEAAGADSEVNDFVIDLTDMKTGDTFEQYGYRYEYRAGQVLFSGTVVLKYELYEQSDWHLVYLGFTDLREEIA